MATRSSRRSNRLSQQPRLTYAGSSDSDSPSDSTPATLESSLPSSAHPTPPVPPEPSGVGAPVSANDGAQGITTHTRTSGSAISATSKSGSKKANTATKGATRRGPKPKYLLRKKLNNNVCHSISQLYKKAVYDNAEAGVEAQSKAVTAVLWHELDRPDATALEKEQYHQYCDQWCPFVQWVQKGNPPGSFVREKKKKLQVKGGTEEVDWEGGYLAGPKSIQRIEIP